MNDWISMISSKSFYLIFLQLRHEVRVHDWALTLCSSWFYCLHCPEELFGSFLRLKCSEKRSLSPCKGPIEFARIDRIHSLNVNEAFEVYLIFVFRCFTIFFREQVAGLGFLGTEETVLDFNYGGIFFVSLLLQAFLSVNIELFCLIKFHFFLCWR